ncbi:hypothetical protein ASPTUDRAFT_46928 [Aspergillus tubingensis CBS 134.48]|uniref:Uncharacterized protein n=1 Tax=Aspergillus tubingensis (strain CBS 134.48) TaxID=767770 RepID=A0A1L9MWW1_ASPTC|nr:hypothetical protein ASPTUDRAFT_46928 [Aspergillus tubingensis CBS 134.48]
MNALRVRHSTPEQCNYGRNRIHHYIVTYTCSTNNTDNKSKVNPANSHISSSSTPYEANSSSEPDTMNSTPGPNQANQRTIPGT